MTEEKKRSYIPSTPASRERLEGGNKIESITLTFEGGSQVTYKEEDFLMFFNEDKEQKISVYTGIRSIISLVDMAGAMNNIFHELNGDIYNKTAEMFFAGGRTNSFLESLLQDLESKIKGDAEKEEADEPEEKPGES